jgi:hypothetical protein
LTWPRYPLLGLLEFATVAALDHSRCASAVGRATESEAFQKVVDWFEARGQSTRGDMPRNTASRTHEIEDSELRVLTASYHNTRRARLVAEGEAEAFERIVWWWYGHSGGRPEAKKFVEEYPPDRWHEIEDSYLLELVEAYWKIKHTMPQPTRNAA